MMSELKTFSERKNFLYEGLLTPINIMRTRRGNWERELGNVYRTYNYRAITMVTTCGCREL
jgi:hypothetical protein